MWRPKIPDWNWWPAIALAALIAIPTIGSWAPALPPQHPAVEAVKQGQAGKEAADPHAHETADERIADYNFWLMVFTGGLAFLTAGLVAVSGFQIRYLIRADSRAAAANDLAEKQMLLAAKQGDLAERQQGLANAQYYAAYRPILVVKDVFFGAYNTLAFEVANVGGITATITKGIAGLGYAADSFKFKEWPEAQVFGFEGTYAPGELKRLTWDLAPSVNAIRILTDSGDVSESLLHFFGAIHYVDDRGEDFSPVRLSVFRRQWDPIASSFRRTGDPDHEYAD